MLENELENVREFCYLGHMLSNLPGATFTDLRIASATAKFNQLATVLRDGQIGMATRRLILEACVRSRLCYATQAQRPTALELKRLSVCWNGFLRRIVGGGFRRKGAEAGPEAEFAYVYSNEDIRKIVNTIPLSDFVVAQSLKYIAHICRRPSTNLTKQALFAVPTRKNYTNIWTTISRDLGVDISQAKKATQDRLLFTRLINQRFPELLVKSCSATSQSGSDRRK